VPGILATASIISGTVLAVFALGINVEKGLNWVRRSERFMMACSLILRDEGEDDGFSSIR